MSDVMKSTDTVGVTFVNAVLGQGALNGVVNLTLGVYQFTPDGDKINPDLVVCSRLRMDVLAAKNLRRALDAVISLVDPEDKIHGVEDSPQSEAANGKTSDKLPSAGVVSEAPVKH